MIISHKYKFIFIKTRKTAGTSIEAALAPLCGECDVITSDGQSQNQEIFYLRDARNFSGNYSPVREMLLQENPVGVARAIRDWYKRPKFYNHISAVSVMSKLSPRVWNSYYKFCFERNSWDKMVSYYYFVHRNQSPHIDLNEYLLNKPFSRTVDQHYGTDWSRYTHKDRVIVDDIFSFDDLGRGLYEALTKCGVESSLIDSIDMPRLKASTRKERGVLSKTASDKVRKVFAREIAYFNYEVPDGMVSD